MGTVIIDLDDTLATTWKAAQKGNRKLLFFFLKKRLFRIVKALILKQDKEFIFQNEAILLLDPPTVIKKFLSQYYPRLPESVKEEACLVFEKAFYEKFSLTDGAIDLLQHIKGRYRLCLVTDGSKEWQNEKIDFLGIREYFDNIIISGEIGTSKKNVRNFELACKGDEKTYVIGDRMETDIRGGNAIGATTILFRNGFFEYERVAGVTPDHSVSTLREIMSLL